MIVTDRDALLVIDVQNDFLPGGALPVPHGDQVVPAINRLMTQWRFGAVIASRDWHPADHCSFTACSGPWPAHCIAGTRGAAFPEGLDQRFLTHIVHKGFRSERESYSAFQDDAGQTTGLDALLSRSGIRRVFLCGVALDYCVAASARDAVGCGFETFVIPEACRGITSDPPSVYSALGADGVGKMSFPHSPSPSPAPKARPPRSRD